MKQGYSMGFRTQTIFRYLRQGKNRLVGATKNKGRKPVYIMEPQHYGLEYDDPVWQSLMPRDGTIHTIGHVALHNFEKLCGRLPQGTKWDCKVSMGMESIKASIVYCNEDFANQDVSDYYQIDRNAAYPSILLEHEVPIEYLGTVKPDSGNFVVVYEKPFGDFGFTPSLRDVCKHFYATKKIGKEFLDYWIPLSRQLKYKKLAKNIMNSAIGAIHRYRELLASRYVWHMQSMAMNDTMEIIETMGGKVIKCHTDSIGWVGGIDLRVLNIGSKMGQWKIEHSNKNIYMVKAGCYQVKGYVPKISGAHWGSCRLILANNTSVDALSYPCIQKGMVIKAWVDDEPTKYTIGV